jgi:hypothetical protein
MSSLDQTVRINPDDRITMTRLQNADSLNESSAESETPDANVNVSMREDIPPNGGFGWVCTICVFLINANTWGVNSVCSSRPQQSGEEEELRVASY